MCYSHPVPSYPLVHVTVATKPLVTNSNAGECFRTPQRRLKTPQFCSKIFYLSKHPQSRVTTGLSPYFISASYPLSINTRIAREHLAENRQKPQGKKPARKRIKQHDGKHSKMRSVGGQGMFLLNHLLAGDSQKRSGQDSAPTPKYKTCLTGGWPHCVKPSTLDKFLLWSVVNH